MPGTGTLPLLAHVCTHDGVSVAHCGVSVAMHMFKHHVSGFVLATGTHACNVLLSIVLHAMTIAYCRVTKAVPRFVEREHTMDCTSAPSFPSFPSQQLSPKR